MSELTKWQPGHMLETILRDPLWREPFWRGFFEPTNGDIISGSWYPRLDLWDEDDKLIARIEIPGLDPKQVEINLQGQTLTIRGERKFKTQKEEGRFFKHELMLGAFQRTISLPYTVKSDAVKATYKNGIMTIEMPKVAEHVGRHIPVEVG